MPSEVPDAPSLQCGEALLGDHGSSSSEGTTSSDSSSDEDRRSRRTRSSRRQSRTRSRRSARESSSESDSDSEDAAASRSRSSRRQSKANGKAGGVDVYTLTGSKNTSDDSPDKLSVWQTRVVVVHFPASAKDLASGVTSPEVAIAGPSSGDDAPADLFAGKNHMIREISVLSAHNSFPISLHIDVTGVKADLGHEAPQSVAAGSGSRGMFTLMSGETTSAPSLLLKASPGSTDNGFVERYPGTTLENIWEGVDTVSKKNFYMVALDHPVVECFNEAREDRGEAALTAKHCKSPGVLTLDKHTINDLMTKHLIPAMTENLRIVNLNEMGLRFSRAFGTPAEDGSVAWDDPIELQQDTSAGFENRNLDPVKHVNLKLAIQYRTLD